MTEKEIDAYKNELLRDKENLTSETISEGIKTFIEMVKEYKMQHPTHTRCVERWRNWYKSVKDDLHKKKVPQEELAVLQYHLETFRVKDTEYAVQRLQNWIDRMASGGYSLNERIIEHINNTLNRYGYSFNP